MYKLPWDRAGFFISSTFQHNSALWDECGQIFTWVSSLVSVAKAEPENIPNLIHQAVFSLRASQIPLSFPVIEIF